MSGLLLFHLVAIPLVFMLGRLSNRIAWVRVKTQTRTSVPQFMKDSK